MLNTIAIQLVSNNIYSDTKSRQEYKYIALNHTKRLWDGNYSPISCKTEKDSPSVGLEPTLSLHLCQPPYLFGHLGLLVLYSPIILTLYTKITSHNMKLYRSYISIIFKVI